jgi:2,3-dihydroxy-2,3-dihydrophenylpropionate dehydrogenase
MGWLEGEVALVTGGGSGLGRALVERLLAEGARVGVLERDGAKAQRVEADFPGRVVAVTGDVTRYEDNAAAVARTVDAFGKLDTFVGNAGVFDYFATLPQLAPEQISPAFDELFGVNVKGYLLGAKAALPELLKSRGCIVYTVSNAGFYPNGGGPIYTASKHAVVGLVRELAFELAPKVRVNGVAPGGMRTELSGLAATGTGNQHLSDMPGLEDMMKNFTPLKIAATPADYCGPYVMLASRRDAAPISGVVINTDGGIGIRGFLQPSGGDDL